MQLSSGEYIKSGTTVLICGATGTVKSFLACALGNKACRLGYKVAYYTMRKLMDVIRVARIEGKDQKLLGRLNKMDVLIIDDFEMKPIDGQQQNDFEQILDDRYKRKALIISSQPPVSDWHALFRNELITDACMDRISHKSIRFQFLGPSFRIKATEKMDERTKTETNIRKMNTFAFGSLPIHFSVANCSLFGGNIHSVTRVSVVSSPTRT